jgi:hypothetical protein
MIVVNRFIVESIGEATGSLALQSRLFGVRPRRKAPGVFTVAPGVFTGG